MAVTGVFIGKLADLAGQAAREVGGRETVTIPFQWPPRSAQTLSEEGESELSTIELRLKP